VANPTLVGSGTPYAGFTVAQMVERLLATFGLTEDSTTGRTVASTEESAQARVFIRRAVSRLNGKFPSIFSLRTTTGTWTAGDHSLSLPSDAKSVLYVLYDGLPLEPMNRVDELKIRTANAADNSAQASKFGDGSVIAWRTTGVTSTNLIVIRLYDTPAEAKSYEIIYNTLAPALTVDATAMPYSTQYQEWVLVTAREMWATELNDQSTKKMAMMDLAIIEKELEPETEAMIELPHKLGWRFPYEAGRKQRGKSW